MRFFLILTILVFNLYSQTYILSGRVFNEETKEPLKDVLIKIVNSDLKSFSSEDGSFTIKGITPGKYALEFSHIGYLPVFKLIEIDKNYLNISIEMVPNIIRLSEIKITSLRSEKFIEDVPLPVSVVDSKIISTLNPNTISDVLKTEPGLNLTRDGIWGTGISVRGLSKSNLVVLINGNRLETATDLAASLSMIDVNEVERVEVIKGAVSSIYGTGALGGVVNIITKIERFNESFKFGYNVITGFNSVNSGSIGRIQLNVSDKDYYFNFSSSLRNASDTKTPAGVLSNSGYRDNSISIYSGFKTSGNQELLLSYQRYNAYDVGIPGASSLFPANALVKYKNVKRDLFSAEYNIRDLFNYFTKFSVKYFYHEIFRDVENIINQKTIQGGKTIINTRILPSAFHKIHGFQIQSDLIINSSNYLIGGFDFWSREVDSRRTREQLIIDTTGGVKQETEKSIFEKPIPNATYKSAGIFLQNETRLFNEKLIMIYGGRWDYIIIKNDEVYNPVYEIINNVKNDYPPTSKLNWKSAINTNNSWSINFSSLYKYSNSGKVTLSLARAFRSPSLEERFQYIDQGSIIRLGNPDLYHEDGIFSDIGINHKINNIGFEAHLFLNNLNNLVVDIPSVYEGRKATIKTNIGKSRLYGIDLKINYVFSSLFSLSLFSSYVNGEDTQNNTPLPLIPPWTSSLNIKVNIFNYADLNFITTVANKQTRIAIGETETAGYLINDLYINSDYLNLGSMKIQMNFGVENILDKEYKNHLSTNRGGITVEPGRNYFIKINIRN